MACFSISGYILWGSYFSLLIHHYHIDLRYLLLYQLLPIIPYFTCSLLFRKWTTHFSKKQVYKHIFYCQLSSLLSVFLLFYWDKTAISFKFLLLVPILLHNIAGSFFRPFMQEKALNVVATNRIGTASSFISICQVGVNAFFSIVARDVNGVQLRLQRMGNRTANLNKSIGVTYHHSVGIGFKQNGYGGVCIRIENFLLNFCLNCAQLAHALMTYSLGNSAG